MAFYGQLYHRGAMLCGDSWRLFMRWHGSGDNPDLRAVQGVEHGLREHQVPVVDGIEGAAEDADDFHFRDSFEAWRQ